MGLDLNSRALLAGIMDLDKLLSLMDQDILDKELNHINCDIVLMEVINRFLEDDIRVSSFEIVKTIVEKYRSRFIDFEFAERRNL